MSKLLGNKVGEEVCKALGLSSYNVASVDMFFHAGEVARIEVTRYLDSTEKGSLLKVLDKYEITKAKDGN
jgi:hypothetical protein